MKILQIAAGILVPLLLGALGGLLGAWLGGNYWVTFSFLGVRGYEALGLVGLLAGLGAGVYLIWKFI